MTFSMMCIIISHPYAFALIFSGGGAWYVFLKNISSSYSSTHLTIQFSFFVHSILVVEELGKYLLEVFHSFVIVIIISTNSAILLMYFAVVAEVAVGTYFFHNYLILSILKASSHIPTFLSF